MGGGVTLPSSQCRARGVRPVDRPSAMPIRIGVARHIIFVFGPEFGGEVFDVGGGHGFASASEASLSALDLSDEVFQGLTEFHHS